jgi:hypothetical protein
VETTSRCPAGGPLRLAPSARQAPVLCSHGTPKTANAGQWGGTGRAGTGSAAFSVGGRRDAAPPSAPACRCWLPQIYVPPHPLVKHWLAVMRSKETPSAIFRAAAAGKWCGCLAVCYGLARICQAECEMIKMMLMPQLIKHASLACTRILGSVAAPQEAAPPRPPPLSHSAPSPHLPPPRFLKLTARRAGPHPDLRGRPRVAAHGGRPGGKPHGPCRRHLCRPVAARQGGGSAALAPSLPAPTSRSPCRACAAGSHTLAHGFRCLLAG